MSRKKSMGRAFVVGVGTTKFEKPDKSGNDYPSLVKEAVTKALEDCNVAFSEIEQVAVGFVNADSTSGQRAIYQFGMTGIPIYNVNNNCATGSTAIILAKQFVESGQSDCVLAVGFEVMEPGSIKLKFKGREHPTEKFIMRMGEIVGIHKSPLAPQLFGNAGIEHMKKYGTRPEHFAKIAHKNHKHSVNNPNAMFRKERSVEEIMSSRKIFGPLTILQCCPNSDGACAAIIVSEKFVKSHGLEARAVEILAMEMATDMPNTFTEGCIHLTGYDLNKRAGERAFAKAGCQPSDVQVIELHDCFSVNELLIYEALGLCPPGKGSELVDRGDNTYGGKYVINPSGGLISKGHPLGATGLAQCHELCSQLRGEAGPRQVPDAKVALQHNYGSGSASIVGIYKLGFPEYTKTTDNKSKL